MFKYESPLAQISKQRRDLNALLRVNNLNTGTMKEIVVFSEKTDITHLDKGYQDQTNSKKYKYIVSESEITNCIEDYIQNFNVHSKSLNDEKLEKIYELLKQNSLSADVLI